MGHSKSKKARMDFQLYILSTHKAEYLNLSLNFSLYEVDDEQEEPRTNTITNPEYFGA